MIAVDGGEVWADDSGGDRPPLVLLHPGIGDSRIWEPVLPALTGPTGSSGMTPAALAGLRAGGEVLPARRPDLGTRLLRPGPGRVRGMQPGRWLRARAGAGAVGPGVRAGPAVPGYPWLSGAWGPGEPGEPDELEAEYEHALAAGDVDALAGHPSAVWASAGPDPAVMEQLRSAARAEISSGDLMSRTRRSTTGSTRSRADVATGRRRGLPAACPGQPRGCGPDPGLRADRGPGDGPPAAPA